MAIVDQLIAVFGYELRDQNVPKQWQKGIDGAEKQAARSAKALEQRVEKIARTAARVGTVIGTAIGTAATAIGVGAIKASAQFESFEATLTTLEGTQTKARESLDWIAKFARQTPYDMDQVTEAFIRLKAYGIDPTDGTLRALGDVGSAMGKSMMQGVEMLADAATGEFERLKEFGLRASKAGDQVTFKWTENGKELTKTVKNNSEEIRKFLIGNFARFEGAMDLQSRTWTGLVSNLGETWTDFLRKVGNAGVFDFAKSRLEAFMARIDGWEKDGTIDKWAKRFSSAFQGILTAAEWLATNIGYHLDYIFKVIEKGDTSKLKWLAIGFAALVFILSPAARWFAAFGLVLDDVLGYLQGRESKFGDFVAWLQDVLNVSKPLAEAIAGVGVALGILAFIKPGAIIGLLNGIVKAATGHGTITLMANALKALAGSFGTLSGMGILRLLGKASIPAIVATMLGLGAYNTYKDPSGAGIPGSFDLPGDVSLPGSFSTEPRKPGPTPEEWQKKIHDFYNKPVPDDTPAQTGVLGQLGSIFQNFMNANNKTGAAAAQEAVTEDNRVQTDARNQSVNVDVGGVRVDVAAPSDAPGALGAAVGRAVGGAAAGAVPPATRNQAPILE